MYLNNFFSYMFLSHAWLSTALKEILLAREIPETPPEKARPTRLVFTLEALVTKTNCSSPVLPAYEQYNDFPSDKLGKCHKFKAPGAKVNF